MRDKVQGVIIRKKDMKVCGVQNTTYIRDEGDDPDPKVACRPPHHQPGPHHLSCTALNQRIGDAANLMQFIALRYGLYCEAMQNGPKFEFKWIISFLDGLVEGEPGKACF